MGHQTVFMRHELKYLITTAQKEQILAAMAPRMALDRYGRTTIRNLYLDTDNYRLIRRSVEKPVYKEKLRIRSYQQAEPGTTVFVELKKKYNGIVSKRRVAMPEAEAMAWITAGGCCREKTQISGEIDYFLERYGPLRPAVFLSYEREAYYSRDGGDFRVTFDDHILCRQEALSLRRDVWGTELLEPDKVLMEIKCAGGMPLWMARVLSRERIYKTSFSKYGTAYQTMIFPNVKGGILYA